MGRYCAHRLDELPPAIAARVRHMMDVLDTGAPFAVDELAEASALLASPSSFDRQRSFELTPPPRRVCAAHDEG